jgi:hypothetical protein
MLHHARRPCLPSTFAGLALLMILCPGAIAQAQTQTVYSPVILGFDSSTARQFQIREDGSSYQILPNCPQDGCGDLSHDGVAGKRYFITAQYPPSGLRPLDLVVYSEDGSSRTVLVSNKAYYPETSFNINWSFDGNRIAYLGSLCYAIDADGQCQFKGGLIVGEIVRDSSGLPVAVDNERLVVEVSKTFASQCVDLNPCVYEYLTGFSWAPDNQRLAYVLGQTNRTSSGSTSQFFVNLVYVPPYPELPATTKLSFSDGDQSNGTTLSFSPVKRLDQQGNVYFRLALKRHPVSPGNSTSGRCEIWVGEVPSGYNGSNTLVLRRVTTSTNAKDTYFLGNIDWSPDEQWLAYDGYTSALSLRNLYKIRSDGSGKSIALTNSKKANFYLSGWRK